MFKSSLSIYYVLVPGRDPAAITVTRQSPCPKGTWGLVKEQEKMQIRSPRVRELSSVPHLLPIIPKRLRECSRTAKGKESKYEGKGR